MIVDFVEKKIEKYTDNKQFGFIRGRNCQLAINELKKEKEYNIIIAIDIFRAYEFIDKKNKRIYRKKIIKYKQYFKKEKLVTCLLIENWLNLVENSFIKMNHIKIKTTKGTTMGSKWSPIIFDLYAEIIKKKLIKDIKENKKAIIIEYADE